jgi:hypothetical protein
MEKGKDERLNEKQPSERSLFCPLYFDRIVVNFWPEIQIA